MSAKNEHGLTSQQEKFAQLVGGGTAQGEAYLAAYPKAKKWKPEAVRVNASKLVVNTNIALRIKAIQAIGADLAGLNAAEILREIRRLALSDIAGIVRRDPKKGARVLLPDELDKPTRAAVASFKMDEFGRIEYKFWDKNAALEKAAKHLGLYEVDNKQKTDSLTELIKTLSGRVIGVAAIPQGDEKP